MDDSGTQPCLQNENMTHVDLFDITIFGGAQVNAYQLYCNVIPLYQPLT